MKRKINILFITIILTIIIFTISTYLQRKLIDYEPTTNCFIATKNIEQYEKVDDTNIKEVEVPLSLILNTKIIQDNNEVQGKYSKDKIYSGQIIIADQLDTGENLRIYEFENGKEMISIKIKSPENAVSFQLRKNSNVNLYITMRNDIGEKFLEDKERATIGTLEDGYVVIKLLENVKILGLFDSIGNSINSTTEREPVDSILIAVNSNEAKQINMIRDLGTFNITEVRNENISN
jgi:hypothetical protein